MTLPEDDRSHWPARMRRLHDEVDDVADYAHLTADERIAMVDVLSREGWAFLTGSQDEPAFRRDVVRIVRRGG